MARRNNKSKTRKGAGQSQPSTQDSQIKAGEPETKESGELKQTQEEGKNDPAWYARDPRLAVDSANIPWNKPFGKLINPAEYDVNITDNGTDAVAIASNAARMGIPGVCTIRIKPSFGVGVRPIDPINVCSNALYTHVRYMNSGRKNYDAPDLFMYVSAWADIYSFIMWVERIYKLAFMYSQRNYYVGRVMLEADGIDVDSIINNLANFRYWINSIINRVSSFCIPGDIYIFQRRVFLYSNYYIENPYGNIKDQLYQLSPEGFYSFGIGANNAGSLKYTKLDRTNPITFSYLSSYFNTLMANINGDEDFGLMSGDILKAYGSNIIGIPALAAEAELVPVHDPYVLAQFKNASVVSYVIRDDNSETAFGIRVGDLGQDLNGNLISIEACKYSDVDDILMGSLPHVLSVDNPDPGVGDVLESTRLQVASAGPYRENGSIKYHMLRGGTEIAVGYSIAYYSESMIQSQPLSVRYAWFSTNLRYISGNYIDDTNLSTETMKVKNFLELAFKYAPMQFLVHITDTTVGSKTVHTCDAFFISSNVDNYTYIGADDLNRIHDTAMLSLYYVPGVAKLIS